MAVRRLLDGIDTFILCQGVLRQFLRGGDWLLNINLPNQSSYLWVWVVSETDIMFAALWCSVQVLTVAYVTPSFVGMFLSAYSFLWDEIYWCEPVAISLHQTCYLSFLFSFAAVLLNFAFCFNNSIPILLIMFDLCLCGYVLAFFSFMWLHWQHEYVFSVRDENPDQP